MEHPIDRAAKVVGSQKALADRLGVTKAAVGQWKEEGRRVPAEHCPEIELLTGGVVRCEVLRPDVKWGVLRSSPCDDLDASVVHHIGAAGDRRTGGHPCASE
ncbi:MAG: transcriptional regulator [Hydrogenophaga sp.]|uniref:transcriptional regulator n=1 Tax=Hydrogenophaga sp. TaxID=1904254 RepID=UPI00403563E2